MSIRLVLLACLFAALLCGAAAAKVVIHPLERGKLYEPGDLVWIAENTIMITETPLNFELKQADAGAIVLHKAGDTLYLVDTGAMAHYRPLIKAAAKALGDAETIILINTHNHIDHTGNNDIIFELSAQKRFHFMTAMAAEYMVDQAGYWEEGVKPLLEVEEQIPEWVPGAGTREYWAEELKIFDPMRVSGESVTHLENLPLIDLDFGGVTEVGWAFGDHDMVVLPTAGHTGGSVVVYFPKVKVLALGDESNRHFHGFLSAQRENALVGFARYMNMNNAGAVDVLVAGHKRQVYMGEKEIGEFLQAFFDKEDFDRRYFLKPLIEAGEKGLTLTEFAAALKNSSWWTDYYERTQAVFPWGVGLIMLKRLEDMEILYRGEGAERRYYLPDEAVSAPVAD